VYYHLVVIVRDLQLLQQFVVLHDKTSKANTKEERCA